MNTELPKNEKNRAVQSIQNFFDEELEIEIGELRAQTVLDFFLKELAPLAYNKGVDDAKNTLLMKTEELDATCFEEPFTYWKKK